MPIISQIAIIVLALCMLFILFRSNRDLDKAAAEEEHFIDTWAMLQEKKERLKEERMIARKEYADSVSSTETPKKEVQTPIKKGKKVTGISFHVVHDASGIQEYAVLDRIPYTIGRDKSNDLMIDDLSVAKKHAVIRERNGGLFLEDTGTSGQLQVAGKAVRNVRIVPGQKIGIGNSQITVLDETKDERMMLYDR